jgi:hypothetical protein
VLWDQLRATIGDVERQLSGVLGVAILDLTSGQELLIRPDEVFPQASSIKIAVLAEFYCWIARACARPTCGARCWISKLPRKAAKTSRRRAK